ncbi:MAG: hypothetical protein HGA71_12370 [Azonexaceae bacterium]|nr:hypothetical protein [Azonexaceae bacterium]
MRVCARPNAFGLKLAVVAAFCSLFGTAIAQTADPVPASGTATSSTTVDHDHKHPLPTTQDIPARLQTLPSTPHPAASQAQGAQLPQK